MTLCVTLDLLVLACSKTLDLRQFWMNFRVTLTLLVLACSVSLVQTLLILMGVLIFQFLRMPVRSRPI